MTIPTTRIPLTKTEISIIRQATNDMRLDATNYVTPSGSTIDTMKTIAMIAGITTKLDRAEQRINAKQAGQTA